MIDKAVLWDVNGVIIDDMRIHYISYREVLQQYGCEVTDEYLRETTVGTPPAEFFQLVLPKINEPVKMDVLLEEKQKSYLRLIKGKTQSPPGVVELMEDLRRSGFKQAVASGTTRVEVDTIIEGCGVKHFFDEIVSCEDVSKGKPDPEPFLKAASLIGIEPSKCLVVEDGEYGVRAAKTAGMKVIAVLNTQTREHLAGADLIVESLAEVSAATVLRMLE